MFIFQAFCPSLESSRIRFTSPDRRDATRPSRRVGWYELGISCNVSRLLVSKATQRRLLVEDDVAAEARAASCMIAYDLIMPLVTAAGLQCKRVD